MIISRKYATYDQLSADQYSREAMLSVFEKYNVPTKVYDYICDPYKGIIVLNTGMGSDIPGQAYQELRQRFDELDKTHPYDNGFTYKDVTNTVPIDSSRKGSAIMQVLVKEQVELPTLIVQVIAFEYRNGEMYFIEPWDVGSISI